MAEFESKVEVMEETVILQDDDVLADLPLDQIRAFSERVSPVYGLLQWKWVEPGAKDRIPTAKEIEAELVRLCADVVTGKCDYARCGGLWAEADEDKDLQFGFSMTEITGTPCAIELVWTKS